MKVILFVLSILFLYKYGDAVLWNRFTNQRDIVQQLRSDGFIKSERVAQAMLKVHRKNYLQAENYTDNQLHPYKIPMDFNMSLPHTHAIALETLKDYLKEGSKVLDIASGSGYLTACFAHMVGKTGRVIAIDDVPDIIEFSKNNVERDNPELLTSGRVKFVCEDGRFPYKEEAPYDVIYFGAYVYNPSGGWILPGMIDIMKNGSRLMCPEQDEDKTVHLLIWDKDEFGNIKETIDKSKNLIYEFALDTLGCDEKYGFNL